MIILYVPGVLGSVDPVVILDYTRSDDQYSPAQILTYVSALANQAAQGKAINVANLSVFSLDYSMEFTHSGNNYGDSLKSKFTATIQNAPTALIGLLNVKQYISQQNVDTLKGALSNITDPQVFFPTGAFVIKPNSNTAANIASTITRTFMLYDTPFNFDSRRINSTLILHGSQFDSMVMRLAFSVSITKTKGLLLNQLSTILARQGFGVDADEGVASKLPELDRYYPPATMNSVLNEICRDNNILFDVDTDLHLVKFRSLGNIPPVPSSPISPILCFNNYVPRSNLITTFSLQNYVVCNFEAEAFDVSLYDTILIYDDTFTQNLTDPLNSGIFAKLTQAPVPPFPIGRNKILAYTFYVLDYKYIDSRLRTSITVRATNNWLITNFKLDTFLENKIYLAPQLPPGVPVVGAPL